MITSKGKHLDRSKRVVIQNALDNNMKAKQIATLVNLDPTNVSREIKNRRSFRAKSSNDKSICSKCANKIACNIRRACMQTSCKQKCLGCLKMVNCTSYEEFICTQLNRFPFVCNGCRKKDICPLDFFRFAC